MMDAAILRGDRIANERAGASGSLKERAVAALTDFALDQAEALERTVGIPELYALVIEDEIIGEVRMRLAARIARLRRRLPCPGR